MGDLQLAPVARAVRGPEAGLDHRLPLGRLDGAVKVAQHHAG